MLHLKVTELDEIGSRDAWTLVRMTSERWAFDQWQEHASSLRQRGGGVVGVHTETGSLLGVATYEAVERQRLGKVLNVETLVAFELSARAPVRRFLTDELDRLVSALECAAVTYSGGGFLRGRPHDQIRK